MWLSRRWKDNRLGFESSLYAWIWVFREGRQASYLRWKVKFNFHSLVHNVITCKESVLLFHVSRGRRLFWVVLHFTEMSFYLQHCLWAQYLARHSEWNQEFKEIPQGGSDFSSLTVQIYFLKKVLLILNYLKSEMDTWLSGCSYWKWVREETTRGRNST